MTSLYRKHLFRLVSAVLALLIIGTTGGQTALAQTSIDTVIHYVEGAPSTNKVAYDVTAYVSVTDSTGNPIKDLKPEDFTVAEDSQQVSVLNADLAADAPINLVILLDTSGSMSGAGIAAAKTAASNFIAGLGVDDRVAVVSFDNTVQPLIDFTTDHKAARDNISLMDATPNAGTCLYDAAYQAVQMTATVPSGRRAVILFTDGVDEALGGGTCSVHTADDVIKVATEAGTRSPIYTLGMGGRVDQKSLQRLAQDTGGRFLYSSDANQLEVIFARLSDALRSQYAIKYSSTAGPGPHTLAVTAKYFNAQDVDTRGFLLPNLPLRLSFIQPTAGQSISGKIILKVEPTFGQGETIEKIIFVINGATVASVTTTPYEAQVDFSAYAAGNLTIDAIAQGAGGIELARVSQTVSVSAAAATVTPTPVKGGIEKIKSNTLIFIVGGVLLLGAGLLVILLVLWIIRRRKERERDREWDLKVGGIGEPTAPEPAPALDRTMDAFEMSADAWGRLTVTTSDDASMIGQHFEITTSRIALGRKADNDIIFPKDSPVSRHHAVIVEKNSGLFLSEVEEMDDKTGGLKRPTYGTFVNESEVGKQSILLRDGDDIRLGKRVRLKFQAGSKVRAGDEKTFDGFNSRADTDETQEA
jgi:VWFA-related protein